MDNQEKFNIDEEAVLRFLNDDAKAGDREKIETYMATREGRASLEKISLRYWEQIPENLPMEGYDEQEMLGRLKNILDLEKAPRPKRKNKGLRWQTYIVRIAAGLFIPLLFISYLQWTGVFAPSGDEALVTIYSPNGARTNFRLPDGSSGWLNSGSALHFPAAFSGSSRDVRLEGEAYFDIESNPDKPFVVTTDHIKVAALGTSFNVEAYDEDNTSKVTLETGIVELFDVEDGSLRNALNRLDTGFQFTYFNDLESYRVDAVDVGKVTAWKEGKLVFREDPMNEVVERLNRWYNVQIVIEDKSLDDYAFRATFQDETLDEVLKLLQLSSPIEIREGEREMQADSTYSKRKIFFSAAKPDS